MSELVLVTSAFILFHLVIFIVDGMARLRYKKEYPESFGPRNGVVFDKATNCVQD